MHAIETTHISKTAEREQPPEPTTGPDDPGPPGDRFENVFATPVVFHLSNR